MPSQQPNDLLLRMAAERRLQLAEARVETVARRVIAGWLTAVQTSILLQASANMTAAGYGWDANAVDAANEYGAWRAGLDAHLLPAVSIVFGEAFQSLRRTDPTSSLQAQQQFIADVSDRLRIWPEGAFEEIRPDLLEAMSDAATFEEMKNRIGAILSVDTQTRDLRAQIGDVDAKLADPDLPDWRRESLTARRAALWNAHDESLSGWEWKARRIARTECLPADTHVSAANITAVYRRHYEGDWIKVKTSSGREISGTPNHPVLTLSGWKGLCEITESDHLVCYTVGVKQPSSAGDEHIEDAPATIGEIFDAVAAVAVPERERGTKPDFHGDGREGYVDVLRPDGLLQVGSFSALSEGSFDSNLSPTDERVIAGMAASRTFSRNLPVPDGVSTFEVADWDAGLVQPQSDHSCVDAERCSDRTLGFPRHVSLNDGNVIEPVAPVRFMEGGSFGPRPPGDAARPKDVVDSVAMASDAVGDHVCSEPGYVELDDVVMVELGTFTGHVFNLTCVEGYFAGPQGIVTSNTHAAIEAGQLARARQVEEETGDVYYKRWLCVTGDTRTRPTHVVADGQMVRLGEKFRVGGFLLDFPGDPITIAPQETIQCRCSTAYLDIDAAQAEVQGPKGSLGAVVPGGRRFGPDDPDEARAAVEQVAAERGQSAPADQRGETFGQAQPVDDSSDTIRLYHHTNADAADAIVRDGFTPTYTSLGRDMISDEYKASEGQYGFFTRDPGAAAGYGDRIVAVDVPRDVVDVDPWSGHTRVRVEDLADAQFHHLDEESPIFDVPDDLTGLSDDQLIELMIAAGNADNDVLFERIDAEFDRRSATLDDTRTEAPEEDSGVPDYRTQPEPDDLDDWWGDDDGQPAPDWGIEPDAPQSESDRLVDEFTQALTDNPDITEDEIATWEQRIADAERREADADKARQKQIELWRRIDELAEREGIDDDEARSRITGETIEQIRRSQFVDQAISDGYLGDNRSFDAVLKSVHDDMVAEWYLAAEDATNGQMLRRASEGKFDPSMFWSVNDATARKHMSDELAEWFDENGGRITRNDLRAMIDAGEHTIQQRRGDYLQ